MQHPPSIGMQHSVVPVVTAQCRVGCTICGTFAKSSCNLDSFASQHKEDLVDNGILGCFEQLDYRRMTTIVLLFNCICAFEACLPVCQKNAHP